MATNKNYYEILGVEKDVNDDLNKVGLNIIYNRDKKQFILIQYVTADRLPRVLFAGIYKKRTKWRVLKRATFVRVSR